MSIERLHPEELIDRAARGALDPSSRAQLDAHLAVCAACRLELRAREDFAADLRAPSNVDVNALIRAALASPAPAAPLAEPRRSLRTFAVAAALVLAFAATAVASPTTRAFLIAAVQAALQPTTQPPQELIPPPAARPAFQAHTTQSPPAPPVVIPKKVAPPLPIAVEPPAAPAPVPERTAAEMLAEASAARREGRHTEARTAYEALLARCAETPEAAIARLALGRLELDQGNAATALSLFDALLETGASASTHEEALAGKARALAQLQRIEDEKNTWRELMRRYPNSLHVVRARERLK